VWRQSEDLWCVPLHLGEEQSSFPPISIFSLHSLHPADANC
jgi:hypothetical protein